MDGGWNKRDGYKRIVGKIIHEGGEVDLEMVRAGHGLWYRRYAHEQRVTDRALYESAGQQARKDRLGLWNDPQPVALWDW